jgi:hypothetical protein
MSETTQENPTTEPAAGDVVHFDVVNPYGDEGETVDTHAGLVVDTYADEDGGTRVRVLSLGRVVDAADFPADAVRGV